LLTRWWLGRCDCEVPGRHRDTARSCTHEDDVHAMQLVVKAEALPYVQEEGLTSFHREGAWWSRRTVAGEVACRRTERTSLCGVMRCSYLASVAGGVSKHCQHLSKRTATSSPEQERQRKISPCFMQLTWSRSKGKREAKVGKLPPPPGRQADGRETPW